MLHDRRRGEISPGVAGIQILSPTKFKWRACLANQCPRILILPSAGYLGVGSERKNRKAKSKKGWAGFPRRGETLKGRYLLQWPHHYSTPSKRAEQLASNSFVMPWRALPVGSAAMKRTGP